VKILRSPVVQPASAAVAPKAPRRNVRLECMCCLNAESELPPDWGHIFTMILTCAHGGLTTAQCLAAHVRVEGFLSLLQMSNIIRERGRRAHRLCGPSVSGSKWRERAR